MTKNRLTNLDVLRAIAALFVCLFHFWLHLFQNIDSLLTIAKYGFHGVDAFFVISGFVIPLTLERTGFRLRNYRSFLAARFLRLYPTYLAAVFITIGLWYLTALSPWFRGSPPTFTLNQILAHLLLTCDFQNEPWIIPVFWTLAIEAQYYLLVMVSYVGFTGRSKLGRYLLLGLWISAPLLAGVGPTIFTWTALFSMGILGYMRYRKQLTPTAFVTLAICAFASHAITLGIASAIIGLLTLATILYLPLIRSRLLIRIGIVSYSLYLLHIPFGGRVINIADRLPHTPWIQSIAAIVALLVSLSVAALFFRYIENPSQKMARTVRNQLRARMK